MGFAFFPTQIGLILKAESLSQRQLTEAILKRKGDSNENHHSLSLGGDCEPRRRRTHDCGFTT